jgi:hypothetical protein
MSRTDIAAFLDILCDMQADGCIREVRTMYKRTGGRVVNHSTSRFSREKLGLIDFLGAMGVENVGKKDVRTSQKYQSMRLNCSGAEMLQYFNTGQLPSNHFQHNPTAAQYEQHLYATSRNLRRENKGSGVKSQGVSCASCGVVQTGKVLRCSGCRMTSYCNSTCQKKHWKKAHRKECVGKNRKSTKSKAAAK